MAGRREHDKQTGTGHCLERSSTGPERSLENKRNEAKLKFCGLLNEHTTVVALWDLVRVITGRGKGGGRFTHPDHLIKTTITMQEYSQGVWTVYRAKGTCITGSIPPIREEHIKTVITTPDPHRAQSFACHPVCLTALQFLKWPSLIKNCGKVFICT